MEWEWGYLGNKFTFLVLKNIIILLWIKPKDAILNKEKEWNKTKQNQRINIEKILQPSSPN